jgi:D-sedoheptulose 7-phosphate isomerase
MNSIFVKNIREHQKLFEVLDVLSNDVEVTGKKLVEVLKNEGKILLCGNGGSAADCQHIAAEFTGRFVKDRNPIAAVSLTTDTSALTCISNDYSFADVFVRQLRAIGRSGDCLIGISTSGNSENVIKAINEAQKMGIFTVGFLGGDGGKLASICNLSLIVPSTVTARIQEAHILIGHSLCEIVEQDLGLV